MYALHIAFLLGPGMMLYAVWHILGAQSTNGSKYIIIIIIRQINQPEIDSKIACCHHTRNWGQKWDIHVVDNQICMSQTRKRYYLYLQCQLKPSLLHPRCQHIALSHTSQQLHTGSDFKSHQVSPFLYPTLIIPQNGKAKSSLEVTWPSSSPCR